MRLLLSTLIFLAALAAHAQPADNLETLLRKVDEAIAEAPTYVAQREARIAVNREAYEHEIDQRSRYDAGFRLYELYRPFVSDSALYYLRECAHLADSLGDHSANLRCRSLLALRCSNIGMYDEALIILDSIHPAPDADKMALGTYYQAFNNVYNELCYYTKLGEIGRDYAERARHYGQLMLETLPPTDEACLQRREMDAMNAGDLKTSMQINDEWLKIVEPGSHPYALVALYRYLEYKARRDTTQMMHWLVESVLADIRNATMDQGSMWELANELMVKGDVERSSRYISYTSECAIRFGSRQRNWQIAPVLTTTTQLYKAQSEQANSKLRMALAALSILALLLLTALFFVHRRNKQLASAHHAMKTLNDELASANSQLSSLNGQLSTVNAQLSLSNRVKEEYIGRFMSLCSQYIDKLDNYRKMVNRRMKNRELEELFRISKSTELKEKEQEELNANFDAAFLHLFPNFISDFNALLQPETQVHPKEENRLTTEIRIFALIRLGIEDSSKIAEFLHYSVNTIYNYRARIKNGAKDNREQFEKRVKEL